MRRIFPTWDDDNERAKFRPLLLPYVILAWWIGCAYIWGDEQRTLTPSFEEARKLADMGQWGVMFLIGGTLLFVTMWLGDTLYVRAAMFIGGCMYTWWGCLFMMGVAHVPYSSLNGPALYWFIAYSHFVAAALTQRPKL